MWLQVALLVRSGCSGFGHFLMAVMARVATFEVIGSTSVYNINGITDIIFLSS